MSIEFQCPDCEESYRLSQDAAGKAVRCGECGRTMRVPQPSLDFWEVDFDKDEQDDFLNDLDTLVDGEQSARKVGASKNQQRKLKQRAAERKQANLFKVICPSCYAPHHARHEDIGNSIRCTECKMIIEIKTLLGSRILLGLAGLGVGVGLGSLMFFLSESIIWQGIGFFEISVGLIFSLFAFFGSDERVTWLITMFESSLRDDRTD